MKRSGLISLICSLVAVMVLCLSVVLILVFTNVIDVVSEELVISSASATATYDGETLIDQDWSLLKGELQENHRLSVVVSGSQTNVGMSENYIFAKVIDKDGNDVSDDYNIVYEPGTLSVKQRAITVTADSKMKLFDGTPLTAEGYSLDSQMSLVQNHKIQVTCSGEITDVGVIDNCITGVVIRNNRGEDVTKNYKIKTVDGKLCVYSPETLVFKTESDLYEYTGEPLVNENWEMVSGAINPTERLYVVVTGSQLDVGTSENTMKVTILDKNNRDVTSNYKILFDLGKLTVIPKEITITSNSDQKVYDGTPLTNDGFTVTPSGVVLPEYVRISVMGTRTEVGSAKNIMSDATIHDPYGKDITSNYKITYVEGVLNVYPPEQDPPEPLTLRSGDAEKDYDGQPLTCEMWKIESGNIKEGHTVLIDFKGEITNVGMVDNDFDVVIVDYRGDDVTDEYFINKETGALVVNKAKATVTSATDQKIYDGQPLQNPEFTVSFVSEYATDFTFDVKVVGSQTAVGTSANTISSCTVADKQGNIVTQNFEIKKVEGELTVVAKEETLKPELTYKTGTSSKTYDGTPLANYECDRILGELLEGHSERIEMTSTLTEVGIIENVAQVRIFYGDEDVTDQYIINYEFGTLEVTPIHLTITTASIGKTYDGTVLIGDSYTLEPDNALLDGHVLNITMPASILYPGTVKNEISFLQILDGNGTDVTGYYKIECVIGELKIFKIALTIESASDQKMYDGKPLTNPAYTVTPEENIIDGHTVYVTVSGTITDPGVKRNTISNVKIQDADGNDFAFCYAVEMREGTLRINEKTVLFTVKTDTNDIVFLKFQSYGDYISNMDWANAPEYTGLIDGSRSAYYMVPYSLDNGGMTTSQMIVTPLAGIFALPYYTTSGNAFPDQISDVYISGDPSNPYQIDYFIWNSTSGVILPSKYKTYEQEYRQFVYDNYLYVDDETLDFMQGIIEQENLDEGSLDVIINKVTKYIKTSARYNLDFDPALEEQENMIIAFLSEYKEGVCRHYASAATMLFRSLGIPARYTVGIAGMATANVETPLTNENLHAWVEVYIDGVGWVKCDVTGEGNPVDGSAKPIRLEITPSEVSQQFVEGTTLYPKNSVSGFAALAERGYRYEVQVDGSNSELGKTQSRVTQFVIYDAFDVIVYDYQAGIGHDRFIIDYKPGVLHNYISKLSFKSDTLSKEYNGEVLRLMKANCHHTGGTLAPGYEYEIVPDAAITYAGQIISRYSVRIYKDNKDCTDHYLIDAKYGTLTVKEKTVYFKAADDTKSYDGTPLTCNGLIYDSSQLAGDDYVYSYVIEGTQTNIGIASNVIKSLVIKNKSGNDVTSSYILKFTDGELKVTP